MDESPKPRPDVADLRLPVRKSVKPASAAADGMWAKLAAKASKQNEGRQIFTKRTVTAMHLGVPSPSLALSYGMASNVIPLSRVIHLAGKTGSFKTALMIDFKRMLLELAELGLASGIPLIPGTHLYNENENKLAADYIWSLFEHRTEYEGVFSMETTRFMDDWMANMTGRVREWDKLFDKENGGPGWCVPLSLSVDSLVGTAPREMFDKVMKAGSPDRSFPLAANLLTQFSSMIPGLIGRRPIWFMATNHLKEFTDARSGMMLERVPGGRAFQHHESIELRMSKVQDVAHAKLPGADVKIKFHKNCLGDSKRSIVVGIRWTYDLDENGEKRQWTMWDWPTASIDLLEWIKSKRPDLSEKISKHLDLNVSSRRVWSSALGIPKTDKVTMHEAGCILEENAGILDAIMPILGIRSGRFFLPGMDFEAELDRDDATPDSMAARTFRRPAANAASTRVASMTGDDKDYEHAGFDFDGDVEE